MTPTMYWRIIVFVALAAGAWYVVHLIRDNATQREAIGSLTAGMNSLSRRAADLEAATIANDMADSETRTQATQGVSRNESARRNDNEVAALDKPFPAAMRHRVFDNPDPASGSTAAAGHPATGERGGEVQKP